MRSTIRIWLGGKIFAVAGLMAAGLPAVAQQPYTPTRIEPGSLEVGTPEWEKTFSIDPYDTQDPAPATVDLDGAIKFKATYKGKVLGLNIGRIFVTADFTDTNYEMTYKVETTGVMKWLDQTQQNVLSYGLLDGEEMTTLYYFKDETEPDNTKKVELTRTAPGERFRYWADPETIFVYPVPPALGMDTVDPLAALAQLGFVQLEDDRNPCDRTVPVYDGRRMFNMRLEPDGTKVLKRRAKKRYEGFTYRCKVFMDKVAGYKPKDMGKDFDGDGYVYLAPMPEDIRTRHFYYLPVLIEGKTSVLSATLEAKSPIVTLPDGTEINMGR